MGRLAVILRQNRRFLCLLLGMGLIRTAVADYNPVPSGSMHPTILEGDVVLVNRLAYDIKVLLTEIIGRATRILVSADITGNWLPRFERFGHSLDR